MIQQKLFPISKNPVDKFERTEEEATPRAGLILFDEFMRAFGLKDMVSRYMPKPGSNRGFDPWMYIEPLVLMLYGGGRHIEDLRELREDRALRRVCGLSHIPSSSAVGDWLLRMGKGNGLLALERVIKKITKKILIRDNHLEYTLWSDPTIVEAEKREAAMTYKGVRGYRPILTAFKEMPVIVWHRFRQGNAMGGVLEAIKEAYQMLPSGRRIKHAALDSEFYQADVINYLRSKSTTFTIVADKDQAVMETIRAIPEEEWRPYFDRDGIKTEREIATTVHCMEKTEAFTLVVLRWKNRQRDLFMFEESCGQDDYFYHAIATDLKVDAEEAIRKHQDSHLRRIPRTEEGVVWRYNERAEMENIIKELKCGIGMEQMPSGSFEANAVYFAIGVLTYNLYVAQKYLIIREGYERKTIHTLRWSFIQVVGRIVRHAGRVILKITTSLERFRHFLRVRQKHLELMLESG